MAVFYLDPIDGNDANAGTSFALRWKTMSAGPTAARIAAGDTIRIIASPDETLVGSVAWTQGSEVLTLPAAVTAAVCACETAWTASANVTAATTSTNKMGTLAVTLAIAAGFTTGKAAYFATGTLDLSAYQQLSFWVKANANTTAGWLRLALCSDAAGATSVRDIAIPALQSNQFYPVVVDVGAALPSSVQSIALYADSDPGTVTITLDNIVACKASSAADALTHHSLVGKVHNKSWAASTAYALGEQRRPGQPDRNGFQYQVTTAGTSGASEPAWPIGYGATVADGSVVWTCVGLEDSWFAIAGFDGTSVVLDLHANATRAQISVCGYQGATETVATYKREPTILTPASNFSTTHFINDSGTLAGGDITYSGGWDRASMAAQTGETWWTGTNGNGNAIYLDNKSYITISHLNAVRFNQGISSSSASGVMCRIRHFHANHGTAGVTIETNMVYAEGVHAFRNSQAGVDFQSAAECAGMALQGSSNYNFSYYGVVPALRKSRMSYVSGCYNRLSGLGGGTPSDCIVSYLTTKGNGQGAIKISTDAATYLVDALCDEAIFVGAGSQTATIRSGIYSHNHNRVAGAHLATFYGGTIRSVTDVRNTASGMAWRFNVTNTGRNRHNPLCLSVLKLQVAAGASYSVQVYARRDNANITGSLHLRGGQLGGLAEDQDVNCDPAALNSWEQSDPLTFTPAEAGVVEIEFKVYCESGTTHSYWIDDISVS